MHLLPYLAKLIRAGSNVTITPDAQGLVIASSSGGGGGGGGGILATLVPPIDAEFAWVNQGGASVVANADWVYLLGPGAAGDNIRIRKKATPFTRYRITAGFLPALHTLNYNGCGLVWRESSSGKLVTVAYNWGSTTGQAGVQVYKYDSPSAGNSQYVARPWEAGAALFFRIDDNGTNRIAYVSNDGVNFQQLHSVGRTDFLTANEVGFFVNANNGSGYDAGATVIHWEEEELP